MIRWPPSSTQSVLVPTGAVPIVLRHAGLDQLFENEPVLIVNKCVWCTFFAT